MFNSIISDKVQVRDGTLVLSGEPIARFLIESELGRGVNGVVFSGRRIWIDQPCALKVWLQLKASDTRDKVQQGLAETRKIASAHPDWVATTFDADVVGDTVFTSMELVPGLTLKRHLQTTLCLADRWLLARLYINGIEKTTTESSAHGDPHHNNVMVYEHVESKFERGTRLKLIDFGTSLVLGPEAWRKRHWQTVDETFWRIIRPFTSARRARSQPIPLGGRPPYLIISYYDDVLNDIKAEAGVLF